MNPLNIYTSKVLENLADMPCEIYGVFSHNMGFAGSVLSSSKLLNYKRTTILARDESFLPFHKEINSLSSDKPIVYLLVNMSEYTEYTSSDVRVELAVNRRGQIYRTIAHLESIPGTFKGADDVSYNLLSKVILWLFDTILIGSYDSWASAITYINSITNNMGQFNIKVIEDPNISLQENILFLRPGNPLYFDGDNISKKLYSNEEKFYLGKDIDKCPDEFIPVINVSATYDISTVNRMAILMAISDEINIQIREMFSEISKDMRLSKRKNLEIALSVDTFNLIFDIEKSFPHKSFYSLSMAKVNDSDEARVLLFTKYCAVFKEDRLKIFLIGNTEDVIRNQFNNEVNFEMWSQQ